MNSLKSSTYFYLAIDAGTQSIRSAIVDDAGQIVDLEKVVIDPYFSDQPGWAEQHPEYYWSMLCQSSQSLLDRQPELRGRLSAVSVTSQRATMINVDKAGEPLRPAILWLDDRKACMQPLWPAPFEWLIKAAGLYAAIRLTYQNTEWNWLVQNQPDVIARTYKYLSLSGYLHFRLSGEFHESISNTVGYLPFDYRKQRWYPERHPLRKLFDIPREKLPELFPTGFKIGSITEQATKQSGIPQGLPLIAGAADKAAEVLGCGVIDSGSVACLSLGTTATVQSVTQRYREVEKLAPLYPSAVAGMYNSEIMIYKGFWMISWFRDQFGHQEREWALKSGQSPEEHLDSLLEHAPAGSLGLVTQPYWGSGVRYPEPGAKGVMLGFGDVHGKAFVYRSIIEGLGYAMREGLEKTEKRLGRKFRLLRVAGGGSQSERILQILADIFQLPTERPHTSEASILGTAINMSVALGHHADYATAVKRMVRIGARFEPQKEDAQLYEQLYRRVYLKMYARLRPLYREIQEITGY